MNSPNPRSTLNRVMLLMSTILLAMLPLGVLPWTWAYAEAVFSFGNPLANSPPVDRTLAGDARGDGVTCSDPVTVTATTDSGAGSLRESIASVCPGGIVNFDLSYPAVITLTTGELDIDKGLTLNGPGANNVTVSGNGASRVFYVNGAAITGTVVISGLTVADGQVTGGAACPTYCGGGMAMLNNARPLLANLVIANSVAGGNGGGLYAGPGSPLTLTHVTVISNTAHLDGGGAYVHGATALTGGTFQNNQCTDSTCIGGGLYVSATLTLNQASFIGNTSMNMGGGAYAESATDVVGSLFEGNLAASYGGGLLCNGPLTLSGAQFLSNTTTGGFGGGVSAWGSATLAGGLFQGNRAGPSVGGGGIYAGGELTLTDTHFLDNSAGSGSNGGGAYLFYPATVADALFQNNRAGSYGGGLYSDDALTLTNTLFTGNSAGEGGGGLLHDYNDALVVNALFARNSVDAGGVGAAIYYDASSASQTILHTTIASPTLGSNDVEAIYTDAGTAGITNTIIASYTTGIRNGGADMVYQDYNLFFSVTHPTTGTMEGGVNSFTGDPAFRDPADDDYHLTAGSAAIGRGANTSVTTDLDGNTRSIPPSIGAYEYAGASATYTLMVNYAGNGSGTVTVSPSGAVFASGTAVTLTAMPNPGSTFVGWSGDVTGPANPITLTMNSAKAVTATFIYTNQPPVANAGSDQTVMSKSPVALDGGGSYDPDGNLPLMYGWMQTGGTAVILSSAVISQPTFTAPGVVTFTKTLTFKLVVTDSLGLASTPAQVRITVKPYGIWLPVVIRH